MPKFVFQLDVVLRQRKHVERQRQRELAIVQTLFAKLQDELRAVNDRMTGANHDLRQNHMTGVIDVNFLVAHRRFIAAMQRQAMTLGQKMTIVRQQVDEAQKALAEAAKQRKVIDKLREHQHARWRAEINRKEMGEADEISMRLSHENCSAGRGH